ncbi:hypothetical protein H8B02_13350 [Bradyrhizobium sp. Pear77]|uniref:hypothetical protein n=1 Tax=Bradyrhizobium altum TaxID=1571202 RepID=UPI001E28F3A2|nr:hypothetical protein [Bradyrhizobium altum]MCC8954399.1 hypothetical protein [Bradyrhizobium altum]
MKLNENEIKESIAAAQAQKEDCRSEASGARRPTAYGGSAQRLPGSRPIQFRTAQA